VGCDFEAAGVDRDEVAVDVGGSRFSQELLNELFRFLI
jgi:hypothetical protein